MNKKISVLTGVFITVVYLVINLFLMKDYGLSWDFHYHHYAGLYHLGLPVPKITDPSPVPFSPPDPRLTVEDPFGPFTQILPTLSYVIFYEKLKVLPMDSAYNLPGVIFGSLGIGLLYFFMLEAFNFPIALFSAVFLALLPNYFGYLHTNMKDIPNAFVFTLAVYLFWRLVKNRRIKDLLLSVVSFAFAFNVKINSIIIPVVNLAWYISGISIKPKYRVSKIIILYFLLAPITALLLWWPFWRDPFNKLMELPYFYSHNTINMPVLIAGKIYRSAVNIPWFYPYIFIVITTPLPILISFITGLLISIKKIFSQNKTYILLIFWFLFPLLRYFSPNASAIDGIRHFIEVLYPLAAISGIGVYSLYLYLKKIRFPGIIVNTFLVSVLFLLIRNIVVFHPYQTSFFNSITGGINGAYKNYDIDYWGTPQREAMYWLNKNSPVESIIYIAMAQSSAGMYLRPDLIKGLNTLNLYESDYTVILNRQSFFIFGDVDGYLKRTDKDLVFLKTINEVPLVWVFRNRKSASPKT